MLTWRNIPTVVTALETVGVDSYFVDYEDGVVLIPFRTEAEELTFAEWEEQKKARRKAMLEQLK